MKSLYVNNRIVLQRDFKEIHSLPNVYDTCANPGENAVL